eukprot:5681175-Lingulodinium_polyedra.AAC.1
MATPPCSPPRGPSLATEATTPTRGLNPALQMAAAISSQRVSCKSTTASVEMASSATFWPEPDGR